MTEVEQLRDRVEALERCLSEQYLDAEALLEILAELQDIDVEVLHDGERGITFRVRRGDHVKEFPITMPALLDRGPYQSGRSYVKGDVVSFGGQIWIAQTETSERPGGNDQWRLAVRHGKDLRNGKASP